MHGTDVLLQGNLKPGSDGKIQRHPATTADVTMLHNKCKKIKKTFLGGDSQVDNTSKYFDEYIPHVKNNIRIKL